MVKIQQPSYQQNAIAELARRELLRRGRDESFIDFVSRINRRYVWYKHCQVIANVVERVERGEIKRLMLFVPPRHSKSETISRLFTAYYLRKHPDQWVGLTSYSADLAYVLSKASQENFVESGGVLDSRAGAVKHWQTSAGGGLWATGIGGPITGKGANLALIDDPLKNAEDASSEVIREKQKEWYNSTLYSRLEPGGAVIIIQTRWHGADISGWLLEQEIESPEHWHVVNLPAIAEEPRLLPDTCTSEPDWRNVGEALCPERYPLHRLEQIRSQIGGYFFDALYQQRPSAKEGSHFKVGQLQIEDAHPVLLRECRAWDLAASAGKGDYTAGVRLGVDADGVWHIVDVRRGQWAPDERDNEMRQASQLDGPKVRIRLAQDPGQAGVDQSQRLTRMLAGFPVRSERVSGDKATRASGLASQINAGNVRLVKGAWNASFIEEFRQFPHGKNDDLVDATADAFNELSLANQFSQGKLLR